MSNMIQYDREMFIFGESVEIKGIGLVRFLTYKEYLVNIQELSLIKMNVLHIYYQYRKVFEDKDEEAMLALEELKKEKLTNIVRSQKTFLDAYVKILQIVLDGNSKNNTWSEGLKELVDIDINESMKSHQLHNIEFVKPNEKEYEYLLLMKALDLIFNDEDMFMQTRQLLMDMQMLLEDLVNPNPEIQAGFEAKRKLDAESNEGITPADIATSIVAGTANSFEEVCSMTVIQVNALFQRIGAFKNYDANIIFASVGADVQIGSWSQKIDLYKKEEQGIKKKDFDKKFGGFF